MSAFFVKNVPAAERVVRVVVSVVGAIAALALLAPPLSFLVAAGAAMFMVTGLVGFCPACAMVGRTLDAHQA